MRDEDAAAVDRIGVSGRTDTRAFDDVADGAEVDIGDDDAPPRPLLGDCDLHVGLGTPLEVDAAQVLLVGPCADEFGGRRAIDTAIRTVRLQRRGAHPLSPGRIHVAQLADEFLVLEQALEVLVPLLETRSSVRDRRLSDRVELVDQLVRELLDRDGSGGCLVLLDAGDCAFDVPRREVELRETDGERRRGHKRDDDGRVLPDQAAMRPCRRVHAMGSGVEAGATGTPRPRG